jgi:citrate/tricarballylate utilization protein
MHATEALTEAERIMTICNACRYCEGHCAVFPAMELRLHFAGNDLNYLANLCHNCGACYHHCQYADPHEFDVNVPRTLSEVRRESYAEFVWPGLMRHAFAKNGYWTAGVTAAAVTAFVAVTAMLGGAADFFAAHTDKFYGVIPHGVMAGLFGFVALFVLAALTIGAAKFWRSLGLSGLFAVERGVALHAMQDAFTLKYLGGGNPEGCTYPGEAPSLWRRRFHHLTFYGFLLCFAATSVGALYHYGFGWIAPYAFASLPKLLGVSGGIGLLIGPAGLLWLRHKADRRVVDAGSTGMDVAFLVLLLLVSATGLALMLAGHTSLIGVFLAVHLGVVLSLFLTMPYGKFTHGLFRLVALIAYAAERRRRAALEPPP